MRLWIISILAISFASCGRDEADDDASSQDGTASAAGDSETGGGDAGALAADSDTDVADSDTAPGVADSDTGAGVAYAIWHDVVSGLDWMNPPAETGLLWPDAIRYCDAFTLNGQDDWRLPTIDELRTLIRGCSPTELTGDCPVVDGTGYSAIETTDICSGCEKGQGGAAEGCYWDPALEGPCTYYWASSPDVDFSDTNAWNLLFYKASITSSNTGNIVYQTRCVRGL